MDHSPMCGHYYVGCLWVKSVSFHDGVDRKLERKGLRSNFGPAAPSQPAQAGGGA